MTPLIQADPIKIETRKRFSQIVGMGTAVPTSHFTQKDVLEFVLTQLPIQESTKTLYKRTLANPSIQKRHFAVNVLDDVLEKNHTKILRRFEKAATELSTQSLQSALQFAELEKEQIHFLVTTTCTGYACPGLSSFIIESAKLNPDIFTADLTGMGCGAAIPALQQAHNFVQANPGASAAVVSTEICSAAMFSSDASDIVITNTLFADGSACVILKSGSTANGLPQILDFASLIKPEWREDLRFQNEGGYLKNVLGKDVPQQSANAAFDVVQNLLKKNQLNISDITQWIVHPGGEKILNAIHEKFGLETNALQTSRTVLKNFGNMSSPSVLFVLSEKTLGGCIEPGQKAVMVSFGAGFSAYATLLEY